MKTGLSFLTLSGALLANMTFPGAVMAAPPKVVADTGVTAALAQAVLGDLETVQTLLPKGADPHHYQMRPSETAALNEADLLIWVGPELTPWLERARRGQKGQALALLATEGTHRRDYHAHDEHEDHDHGGDDHHHGADEGHHHDEDHHHDGIDPHAWLDPANGRAWVKTIAAALTKADPENAAVYAENAAREIARINAAETEINARLMPVRDKPFVVFHDAYGYFTDYFGLKPAIAVSLGDASAPSAGRLRAIKAEIIETGATCAFPEANHSAKLMQSLLSGTSVKEGAALDPAGTQSPPGAALYTNTLTAMAGALADCLTK